MVLGVHNRDTDNYCYLDKTSRGKFASMKLHHVATQLGLDGKLEYAEANVSTLIEFIKGVEYNVKDSPLNWQLRSGLHQAHTKGY